MARRPWTCAGCGHLNEPRSTRYCAGCHKLTRPPKRSPKHRAVLAALSMDDAAALSLAMHGGRLWDCASCGREREPGKRRYRDHDHRSGAFRGLLCFQCNRLVLAASSLGALLATLRYLVRAELHTARQRARGVAA